jgi:hypothetical protein
MTTPWQWDQELADQLLVADPMSTLLQRVSREVAHETDRVIREILCAKRPGWTMDQAKHSVRLVGLLPKYVDLYWDQVKLGSYQIATECADGEIKIKSQIFLES